MGTKRIFLVIGFAVLLLTLQLFTTSSSNSAQLASELNAPYVIQAQAMGTKTQLGRNYSITARINEYSPPEDQAILLEAFKAKGNKGLVNALSKMPAKGRLAITGTLGGDLAYIRRFDQPDGSIMLRMITNRLLRFGEAWADTRSADYQLSGLEITFSKDGKSKGTLVPAAQLKLDKQERIGIETFQWPWDLVNIQIR